MGAGPINFEITGLDLVDPGEMDPMVDVLVNSDGVTTDVYLDGEKTVRVNVYVRAGEIIVEMSNAGDGGTDIGAVALVYETATGNVFGSLRQTEKPFDDPGVKVA